MLYTQNLSSGDQSHVIKSCNVRKIFGTIYITYFYPFLIYLYLAYLNIVLWSVLLCGCSYGEKRKRLYSEKILFFSDKYFHIQRKFDYIQRSIFIFRVIFIFKEIQYIQINCIFKGTFLRSEKAFISIEIVFIQRNVFLSKENVDIKKNWYIERKPKIQVLTYLSYSGFIIYV